MNYIAPWTQIVYSLEYVLRQFTSQIIFFFLFPRFNISPHPSPTMQERQGYIQPRLHHVCNTTFRQPPPPSSANWMKPDNSTFITLSGKFIHSLIYRTSLKEYIHICSGRILLFFIYIITLLTCFRVFCSSRHFRACNSLNYSMKTDKRFSLLTNRLPLKTEKKGEGNSNQYFSTQTPSVRSKLEGT